MRFTCHTLLLCARQTAAALALFMALWQQNASASGSISAKPLLQYHSRSWQTDGGLPMDIIQAVAQTPDGYLWVGTPRGLARFDGVHFKVFTSQNTPALKSSYITSLCQSSEEGLWIGTTGGLTLLKEGQFSSIELSKDDARENNVRSLFEAQDGSLWVGTMGGLFQKQNGEWRQYTNKGKLADLVVRTICEGNDGEIWIGTVGGVSVWKDGVLSLRTNISDKIVRKIYKDREGTVWFGLANGLCRLRDGKFTLYGRKDGLPDNNVSAIYQDRRGDLWVGSYGGLSRFVNGKFVTEKDDRGSLYDQINVIDEDEEHDIWVGARDGLYELRAKRFTTFTRLDGLPHNNITSVLEDHAGNICVGTWGGGVCLLNQNGFTSFNPEADPLNKLESDTILGLCEDADGSLLIGADYEGGTYRMKDGVSTRFWSQEQAKVDEVVRLIYRDHENNLWFGCNNNLVLWNERKKFLHNNAARCMLEDHAGTLWVGTSEGLFYRTNGQFTNWTSGEAQLKDTIHALHEDQDGNLWIGTDSTGLRRLKDDHLTSYTTRQGMLSDGIFEILEDDHGWLWMSSAKGIFRVSKKSLDELDQKQTNALTVIAYGRLDGLETLQCSGVAKPGAWKSRDGHFWFATTKGLAVTDPNIALESNKRPPPVILEEVVANNQHQVIHTGGDISAWTDGPLLRIPPGRGDLEFHYTGLSFPVPEKMCFQYKLDGVDHDWIEVTRRVAYYNNLPPGNYRFHVRACNNDGVWSETIASQALILEPHFWQTWWFSGSAALLAVAMAGGTVRYTTKRKMEQELRRLEKQHAIEEERIRIARDMHDEIGAKLTKISFLGAMARRKPDDAGTQIDKMSQTARDVIRALDEIVWAVNPANDTLEHFATYLCRNATEFFENSPIQCQFKIPDELPSCRLGTDLRHNLLLAAKEALNNALKHSGATNVVVALSVQQEKIELVIADNGHGFERNGARADTPPSRSTRFGNGLTNMQQRLEAIGGNCVVTSQPGQGTCIVFTVILKGDS